MTPVLKTLLLRVRIVPVLTAQQYWLIIVFLKQNSAYESCFQNSPHKLMNSKLRVASIFHRRQPSILFLYFFIIGLMNALQAKLASQQKLLSFLAKQLQQQQTLEKYYHSCLNEITGQGTVQEPQFKLSPSPTKKPQRRMKTEECPSLMEESLMSIELNKSKVEKTGRKDGFSSEMEYQQVSKEVRKIIDGLVGKEPSFKKSIPSTPQRNKSFTNKSGVKPGQALKITANNNLSLLSMSKTDRFQKDPQTDKQKMLSELGDTSPIVSNDEIVVNLLSHLRLEQQKFSESIFCLASASSTKKIRNYMVHLCEKNEQSLFKLRQKEKETVESRLEMNRQMVRNGYTERMKQLIENAFTSSKQFH